MGADSRDFSRSFPAYRLDPRGQVRERGGSVEELSSARAGAPPAVEELAQMRARLPLILRAAYQARQAGIVPGYVGPAGQRRPADVEREQVEAVGLAVGP